MGWAIVAIPEDRDPVWKYSSEKVPHMTLLFLGDQTNDADLPGIVQYIEHVAKTTMWPFGMVVDRRGTLGDQQADVLFFEKDSHGRSMIKQVLGYFLANSEIKKLYDSTQQFPDWIPHLTMGFPKTPAKKDDREYPGFSYVSFDRIALWTDDYSGPEFRLEGREAMLESPDVVMSGVLEAFLAHHGVKGMKWGVRNDKGHEGEQAKTKKIAKLDKKYERQFEGLSGYIKIQNDAAAIINPKLDVMNAKPEYKGKDMYDPANSAVQKKYHKEYENLLKESFKEMTDNYGTNASGTGRVRISLHNPSGDVDEMTWHAKWEDIKHAGVMDGFVIVPKRNSTGHIIGQEIKPLNDALKQAEDTEAFLAHFGVKGMHWGRRKADIPDGEARATQKKPGVKVKTAGGHGVGAHDDAVRTALSKQIAKNSTTDALSTKELQDLVTRMNLEQQYSKLSTNSVSPGRKFVNELLINTAKQQATQVINQQTTALVEKQMKKAGVK